MQSATQVLRRPGVLTIAPRRTARAALTRSHATHAPPPGRKSRFPETASLERVRNLSPLLHDSIASHRLTITPQFLLRQKVMSLWRRILRDTCRIEDPKLRAETRETAKHEFVRNKDIKEVDKIKYFTATGKTEWEVASRYIDGL